MKEENRGGALHAITAIALLAFSTILCFIPVFFLGLLKLFPYQPWQKACTKRIDAVASLWSDLNNWYIKSMPVKWEVRGLDNLSPKAWYLVVANHQSWLDIVILQRLFNRQIPVLKFFIKDHLKWIPLLGFTWWAMDFPFMKRYSSNYLARKPHKRGQDLVATLKAVKKFQQTPVAVMNFVEGTRFTSDKHEQQKSPYRHLLKPKAGGIGYIISTMGQQINSLLDVTIIYPEKNHSLWDFLCRRVAAIKVDIRHLSVPGKFNSTALAHDKSMQDDFKAWLHAQWSEKDRLISTAKNKIIEG